MGEDCPEQCSLEISSQSDIEELKKDTSPHAYVVKASCLETFRKYPDMIEDRGVRDDREGLFRKMKHAHKISIIDGKAYKVSTRISQGVLALLENAVVKKKFNLCIIGVQDKLFDELFSEAARRARVKSSQRRSQALGNGSTDGFKFPDSIMRLMENHTIPEKLTEAYLGRSKEAEFVRRLILLVAKKDTPVLIVGATGTGKEVVAREIHDNSKRKGRFVPINCGAITETLFESELFGCLKGTHSTAHSNKIGVWETADKGTLFLDEIGDLPLDMQAKILRALQENSILPVGARKEIPVDARIIAATNRDLFSMVQSGTFREDLYYRLRDFYIPTPSLKDHPDDIPLMAQSFWTNNIPGGKERPLSPAILTELREYPWPGNARELKAVLNQLNTLFPAQTNLGVEHLLAILEFQGQLSGHKTESSTRPRQEQSYSRLECRLHLRRVEDAIRATEVATAHLTKCEGKGCKDISKVATSLAYRLDELDMLCRYPLRFNNDMVFVRVNTLKSKLFYLYTLLASGDVEKALSNWEDSVRDEFAVTLPAVKEEVELIKMEKRL